MDDYQPHQLSTFALTLFRHNTKVEEEDVTVGACASDALCSHTHTYTHTYHTHTHHKHPLSPLSDRLPTAHAPHLPPSPSSPPKTFGTLRGRSASAVCTRRTTTRRTPASSSLT